METISIHLMQEVLLQAHVGQDSQESHAGHCSVSALAGVSEEPLFTKTCKEVSLSERFLHSDPELEQGGRCQVLLQS